MSTTKATPRRDPPMAAGLPTRAVARAGGAAEPRRRDGRPSHRRGGPKAPLPYPAADRRALRATRHAPAGRPARPLREARPPRATVTGHRRTQAPSPRHRRPTGLPSHMAHPAGRAGPAGLPGPGDTPCAPRAAPRNRHGRHGRPSHRHRAPRRPGTPAAPPWTGAAPKPDGAPRRPRRGALTKGTAAQSRRRGGCRGTRPRPPPRASAPPTPSPGPLRPRRPGGP